MDTGKVPGEIGTIPDHREVIDPPGGIWALLGLSGKEGKGAREGAPLPSPIRIGKGAGPPFPSSLVGGNNHG